MLVEHLSCNDPVQVEPFVQMCRCQFFLLDCFLSSFSSSFITVSFECLFGHVKFIMLDALNPVSDIGDDSSGTGHGSKSAT